MFSKEQFTTVTPLSKVIALTLFIALPIGAFYLGVWYGKASQLPEIVQVVKERETETTKKQEWVTYHNNPAGFEIDFPADWGEIGSIDWSWVPLNPDITQNTSIGDEEGDELLPVYIDVGNENFRSIDDYVSFILDTSDFWIIDREELVIENGIGEKIIYSNLPNSTVIEYVFMKGIDVIVAIELDQNDIFGSAAVSTFRFVE